MNLKREWPGLSLNDPRLLVLVAAFYILFRLSHRLLKPGAVQIGLILAANLAIFAYFAPGHVAALFTFVSLSYFCAKSVARASLRKANIITTFYVLVTVATLVTFKSSWLGGLSPGWQQWVIPLGYSFILLQNISFVVDSRACAFGHTWLEYLAIGTLFANVTAGPIARPKELLTQLKAPNLDPGPALALIVSGLFKKSVADVLAPHAAFLFSPNVTIAGQALALLFLLGQYYADFSGYTDLARGFGALFGFNLPENFNLPYFAVNMADYWRRWHMSMSLWFRDYVFFPLELALFRRFNASASLISLLSLLSVFSLIGLWHGLQWHLLLWGLMNGALVFLAEKYAVFRKGVFACIVAWIGIACGEVMIMSDALTQNAPKNAEAVDVPVLLTLALLGLLLPHAIDFVQTRKILTSASVSYYAFYAFCGLMALLLATKGPSFIYAGF